MNRSPRILLGVSGGIAAYKSAEVVRGLVRAGAEVRVAMTRGAREFVAPLTFAVPRQIGLMQVLPGAIFALVLAPYNLSLRPMIASSALLLAQHVLVHRWRADHVSWKATVLLVGLFYLLWSNLHMGVTIGFASLPLFWTLPTALLTGSAAAGGIALINSIGNLSGFTGPFIMGRLKDTTHSFTAGLLVIAASMALAAVLGYVLSRRPMSKWGGFERHGAGGA